MPEYRVSLVGLGSELKEEIVGTGIRSSALVSGHLAVSIDYERTRLPGYI